MIGYVYVGVKPLLWTRKRGGLSRLFALTFPVPVAPRIAEAAGLALGLCEHMGLAYLAIAVVAFEVSALGWWWRDRYFHNQSSVASTKIIHLSSTNADT